MSNVQARNQDFVWGGGAFCLEVSLAIIVVIKQSDWDVVVNKVVKGVVTVYSNC